jgi:hypothetical protein
MPTYSELTETVGDQVVDAVKQAEERTVSLVSSVNELTSKLFPSAPAVPAVPGVEGLPSASDVVAANAALMERLLQAQTSFALSVLESIPTFEGASPKKKAGAKS